MELFTRIFSFLLSHWEVVSGIASAVIAPAVFFWRSFDRRIRRQEIELSRRARGAEVSALEVRRDLAAAIEQIRRVQDQGGGMDYLRGVVGRDNDLWHKVTFGWVESITTAEKLCAAHGVAINSSELCRLIGEHRASGHKATLGVWDHEFGATPLATSGRLNGACATLVRELTAIMAQYDARAESAKAAESTYRSKGIYSHLLSALLGLCRQKT